MLQTTRRKIEYPETALRLDAPDIPLHLRNIAVATDVDIVYGQGTLASRPAAGDISLIEGTLWWATDVKKLSYYDGTNWYDVGASDPLIGTTYGWPWDAASIPANCILLYGQAISRTTYVALNALASGAGYPYGNGNGVDTFNVLDERGRVEVGKGNMGGTNANRITVALSGSDGTVLGATIGAEGVAITTGQMPAHNHGVSDPGHRHDVTQYSEAYGGPASDGVRATGTTSTGNATTGITIQNTGGGQAHLNVQPSIIVNKIMKALP